jgi:hypothetical protein
VHSIESWEELLLPEIERQQRNGKELVFRADAAFAMPEIYDALEARAWSMPSVFRQTIVWNETSTSC